MTKEKTVQNDFNKFYADWDDSYQGHTPAYIKDKKEVEKSMKDFPPDPKDPNKQPPQIDQVPPEGPIQRTSYKNIWEVLDDHGVKRENIALVELTFDVVNDLVTKLRVKLHSGNEMYLEGVQLTRR